MKKFIACALLICSMSVTVGCGSLPAINPVAVTDRNPGERDGNSWMASGAATIKMLYYASDAVGGIVRVFNYQTGHAVGTLRGFSSPQGQCVGAAGQVFIANEGFDEVDMFVHGHVHPAKSYRLQASPVSCAVSSYHDLAIGNAHTIKSENGDVVVFKDGKSQGVAYKNKSCYRVAYVAYDAKGNLYVQAATYHLKQVMCELPRGGSTLKLVGMNVTLHSPEGMMWDGKHIAISDIVYGSSAGMAVYQMDENAKGGLVKAGRVLIGSNSCNKPPRITQPFLLGSKNTPENRELATEFIGQSSECSTVDVWHYPAGGDRFRSFKGARTVSGQSVSIAP